MIIWLTCPVLVPTNQWALALGRDWGGAGFWWIPPSIFPSITVLSNESVLHIRWPKYWSFSFSIRPSNEYSGLISFHGLVGSPRSARDSQEFSPTPQFKSISSSALSFLYTPTLTSIHDYWKNHSFDYTPGEGNGHPHQYSCLGKPMDRRRLLGHSPWDCRRVRHTQ